MTEFRKDDRVRHHTNRVWGIGQVIDISAANEIQVFFVWAGLKIVPTDEISNIQGDAAASRVLDTLAHVNLKHSHKNVYVIELDKAVLNERAFKLYNPNYTPPKPCVYVGRTGRTVEERFQQHLDGYYSNVYVRRYGRQLMYELFEHLNPRPYEMVVEMEIELALKLRSEGYAVYQA
jgi:hypothetical protein